MGWLRFQIEKNKTPKCTNAAMTCAFQVKRNEERLAQTKRGIVEEETDEIRKSWPLTETNGEFSSS